MGASGDGELLVDLFAPLGGVSMKRMFGGIGIFREGLMFGLQGSDGILRLKADEETAPAFAAEGCEQWTPEMGGRAMAMPYWRVPERLFDEPEEFTEWARRAFAAAVRTRKPQAGGKKKKKTTTKRP